MSYDPSPLTAATLARPSAGTKIAVSCYAANLMPPTSTSTASSVTTWITSWKPSPSSDARTSGARRIPHKARNPGNLRRDAAAMEAGMPYHTRLDPPPAHGWTPPEITLEAVTAQQGDRVREDAANVAADSQRRADAALSQPAFHFDDPD